jgi:hydroxypyruvate reductase
MTGVDAVRGDMAVANALRDIPIEPPDQIIAVGKAAGAMARAAHDLFPQAPVLVVTKHAHGQDAPAGAEVIEAAHPVLDDNSLRAGQRLLDVVSGMPAQSHLLLLVSGGASALAEAPEDGHDLQSLKARAQELLASGANIQSMNETRRKMSRIKGGKLLSSFKGDRVTSLAISDVEGDALSVIGSGLGDAPDHPPFRFDPRIVASNAVARAAIAVKSGSLRVNDEGLYADIHALAPRLAAQLTHPGLYVFGGEPTVVLPPEPGQGGRNQALALLLAREIAGRNDVRILVAGTDGTDGPTDAAGAIVDGDTWGDGAAEALARADALPYLNARGALLRTGPTGTNVMDLVIAEVAEPA